MKDSDIIHDDDKIPCIKYQNRNYISLLMNIIILCPYLTVRGIFKPHKPITVVKLVFVKRTTDKKIG